MVFPTFDAETVESVEFGLKSTFAEGKARANIAHSLIPMKIFNSKRLIPIFIEAELQIYLSQRCPV